MDIAAAGFKQLARQADCRDWPVLSNARCSPVTIVTIGVSRRQLLMAC
jgi:hypothetical protein